jgi:hypothetical protein
MKMYSWIGLAGMILGVGSLLIPIPHSEDHGFRAGGVSVGIETHDAQTVSPLVSAVMILGGASLMIVQKVRTKL